MAIPLPASPTLTPARWPGLRLGFAIAAAIATLAPTLPAQAQTQNNSAASEPSNTLPGQAVVQRSGEDSRRGAPTRRLGGGSRSTDRSQNLCSSAPQTLAMIAPPDNVTVTTAARPSLMFYINGAEQTRELEFILRDVATNRALYGKMLTLPEQGGLVTLDLEEFADAPELAVGGEYYWYLSLICDGGDRAKDIVVEGDLRRVAAIAPTNSPLSSGLWHDAMDEFNRLRQGQVQERDSADLRQEAQRQWLAALEADRELAPIAAATQTWVTPLKVVDLLAPD